MKTPERYRFTVYPWREQFASLWPFRDFPVEHLWKNPGLCIGSKLGPDPLRVRLTLNTLIHKRVKALLNTTLHAPFDDTPYEKQRALHLLLLSAILEGLKSFEDVAGLGK